MACPCGCSRIVKPGNTYGHKGCAMRFHAVERGKKGGAAGAKTRRARADAKWRTRLEPMVRRALLEGRLRAVLSEGDIEMLVDIAILVGRVENRRGYFRGHTAKRQEQRRKARNVAA